MSLLVTLYSVCKSRLYCLQFQHARLCSVLISSFCAKLHLPGYGRLLGKDTKSLGGFTLSPNERKRPNDSGINLLSVCAELRQILFQPLREVELR